MSKYTSIILFISGMEDEDDRIREVNAYQLSEEHKLNLTDVNTASFPDFFPRFTYCGTYRDFDIDKFMLHLREKVNWEYPQYISLVVQVEQKPGVSFLTL